MVRVVLKENRLLVLPGISCCCVVFEQYSFTETVLSCRFRTRQGIGSQNILAHFICKLKAQEDAGS
jgi:hypothetical protein